ncbi:hypothetical protein BJX68DRAFT_16152 [Aspergillus pseudodeflectus]|uniref:Uncharacterized protein n=1 Tax=Aspergillus pseudodeflectus TaxID=176178 RepID=A0ABR4LD45_9EURO
MAGELHLQKWRTPGLLHGWLEIIISTLIGCVFFPLFPSVSSRQNLWTVIHPFISLLTEMSLPMQCLLCAARLLCDRQAAQPSTSTKGAKVHRPLRHDADWAGEAWMKPSSSRSLQKAGASLNYSVHRDSTLEPKRTLSSARR